MHLACIACTAIGYDYEIRPTNSKSYLRNSLSQSTKSIVAHGYEGCLIPRKEFDQECKSTYSEKDSTPVRIIISRNLEFAMEVIYMLRDMWQAVVTFGALGS